MGFASGNSADCGGARAELPSVERLYQRKLMSTRADRIEEILKTVGGRLSVAEIGEQLARIEGVTFLHPSTVSATVRQDNATRGAQGRTPRFNHSGDGTEEWGVVSLR